MNNFAFLPGFAVNSGMYSRLDVYRPEFGIEITPKQDWESTVDDISNQIAPGSILVGYSQGARLGLAAALQNKTKIAGLVMISLHCGIRNEQEKAERIKQDHSLSQLSRSDLSKFWETFEEKDVFQTKDEKDRNFWAQQRKTDVEKISTELEVLGLGKMPFLEDHLIELRMPVLYLTGSLDRKFCELNARYKKLTPFSHHRTIDSDHRLPLTAPKLTNLYIEWFAKNVV